MADRDVSERSVVYPGAGLAGWGVCCRLAGGVELEGRWKMALRGKVVITCAVTGSIHTPTMSPYLPLTPDLSLIHI